MNPARAADSQPATRLRLLALHGMGTSAQILARQLRPLADAVADVAELVYLDGQEPCAPVRRAALLGACRALKRRAPQADAIIAKVFPGGPVRGGCGAQPAKSG
jgi:hypothetical protein